MRVPAGFAKQANLATAGAPVSKQEERREWGPVEIGAPLPKSEVQNIGVGRRGREVRGFPFDLG